MKKGIRIIAVILVLAVAMAFMASCSLEALSDMIKDMEGGDETKTPLVPSTPSVPSAPQAPVTTPGNEETDDTESRDEYMTREEVEELISGIEPNISVTEQDITINSNHSASLLAASKGLLSAVSINAIFECAKQTLPYYQPQYYNEASAGAGVIYSLDKTAGDAYIITNYHVVYNIYSVESDKISNEIKVYLYGMEYEDYAIPATYVGGSMKYDIAVLKVEGSNILKTSSARAANFADSNDVSVLQTAIAIGNPEGEGISATVGAINVDSENITMTGVDGATEVTMRVMRIDAAVNGGNSGGGLFDDEGNVIGIVNAKITSSTIDNIGYAIPSNVAKAVAENIIYYDNMNEANDGVYRVMLGISVSISESKSVYDETTGKVHKVETVIVSGVDDDSIVKNILSQNDVINSITVDGKTYSITRSFTVVDAMLNARQGSAVKINVTSGGIRKDVSLDLSSVTPTLW